MKCVWDENSPKRTQARTPLHPSPAGRRPPTRPSRDAPALLLPRTRRGLVAIDKGSYRFGRSPSGRPARRLSELTSTRAGGNLGGPGRRGSRAALRPALPASAARPIVAAIWPAKAALPPRPPPLPRLKLINGRAYRRRHRLCALSARHIYLCAEQKAHRGAGSCAPALVGAPGGAAAQALGPLPSTPAAWSQVRPERRAHSRQGPTHSRRQRAGGRGRACGRRRLVTISARILTRQDLPGGGGARGRGLKGGCPGPASQGRPSPQPAYRAR